MKLTRLPLAMFVVSACLSLAPVVHAATVCTDDPERCAERGASTRHVVGVSASAVTLTPAPAPVAAAPIARNKPVARKAPARAQHAAPHNNSAPTPGMGMLLKLSVGTSGDGSWSPARPADAASGASWIL